MKLDENEFFRNATLRICSSLDIEKSFWDFFVYISKYVSAQDAYLIYRKNESPVTTIFAHANKEEGRLIGHQFKFSEEVRAIFKDPDWPGELLLNHADNHIVGKELLAELGLSNISALVTRLIIEERAVGSLILMTKGWNKFSPKDQRLISLLKKPAAIALANSIKYHELSTLKEKLSDDNRFLQEELRSTFTNEVVGADFGLKKVMNLVHQVASENAPVLILGETGVGKEVIATAIHNLSNRRLQPFIKMNCGSIPETLIDSELFGHEKGAFTGAYQQFRGRFERAEGGTLFLDEIGELPPAAQVRLLRVLQEKEIERVGGSRPIKIDVRLIIATHRDLWQLVEEGKFRQDLLYRLNVFPIEIPPLRDRKSDIPALFQYFLVKKAESMALPSIPRIAHGEIERLLEYSWPGNVRELENMVERALIMNRYGPIRLLKLRPAQIDNTPVAIRNDMERPAQLNELIRNHIEMTMQMTKGKIEGTEGAAELLGINPSTLRHKMRKLSIQFGRKAKSESS